MISLIISANDSPLHGKEGDKITYSQIKDRLFKESENDVSLKIVVDPKKKDKIQVFGRGDLHLGILIEKLLILVEMLSFQFADIFNSQET